MFKLGRTLPGRILVKPDIIERETSFGVLLPESKEKTFSGTVVLGNKDIQEGDRIQFSAFGIDEIKLDGEDYTVVSDSGILFIYDK